MSVYGTGANPSSWRIMVATDFSHNRGLKYQQIIMGDLSFIPHVTVKLAR